MSKHDPIRKDKTCLNCHHVAEERFCTHCGQENTDSRKTFHHLFIHFFEDLTHYENAFWKTIRHLITKPGRLTREYLSGKRLSYLAPIRLYIFISFITFFLIAVLPDTTTDNGEDLVEMRESGKTQNAKDAQLVLDSLAQAQENQLHKLVEQGYMSKAIADSIIANVKNGNHSTKSANFLRAKYTSVHQLDSIQKYAKPENRLEPWHYWMYKRYITVTTHNSREEIFSKFKEEFMHNFPKVLFIYMPIFAFFLWLFNDKKRWYYFDHGIFTLHYFSFLLLMILINFLLSTALSYLGTVGEFLDGLNTIVFFSWFTYYFFPAHHRFYGDSRIISSLKSIGLLFVNFFIISVILVIYSGYTLLNLH